MRGKKKAQVNYLDMIPARKPELSFHEEEDGKVVLAMENKGVFNRVAQALLRKPRVSYIHLDELGSFVWLQIDRENTVGDIAALVHDRFGDKAEPLYPRLVQYFKNLEASGLITLAPPVSK